ncbi:enoyl-CoA hydratase/isomerase family protein [Xylogone sp. PMI_703]|nr:enoyl-CoA hydratase/isomerase family protein [Xylogone sp. PMI_703]
MKLNYFRLILLEILLLSLPIYSTKVTKISNFGTINQSQAGGVLDVIFFNNSTDVNLYDNKVQSDLFDLVTQLQDETSIKAVVFRSGNEKFFFALLNFTSRLGELTVLFFNLTQLPMTTIAATNGRAHGVGSEFLLSCDMRFATVDNALIGQPEVSAGIIPGAGGAQNLARLIGRGRAIEYILAGRDITAVDAEKIGWINQVFNTTAEMDAYIDQLTQRIALYPLDGLAAAKTVINSAVRPSLEDLHSEWRSFVTLASSLGSQKLLQQLVEVSQNETSVPFFLNMGDNLLQIYNK